MFDDPCIISRNWGFRDPWGDFRTCCIYECMFRGQYPSGSCQYLVIQGQFLLESSSCLRGSTSLSCSVFLGSSTLLVSCARIF